MCKQNNQPECVMAVTDVSGNTSVPCALGAAAATRLGSLPPSVKAAGAGRRTLKDRSLFLPLHTTSRYLHGGCSGLRRAEIARSSRWAACPRWTQVRRGLGRLPGRGDYLTPHPSHGPSPEALFALGSHSGSLEFFTTHLQWL